MTSPENAVTPSVGGASESRLRNGSTRVSASRNHGCEKAAPLGPVGSRFARSSQTCRIERAVFSVVSTTSFRNVTSPPSEETRTALEGPIVEKYVLYQNLLFKPAGRRNGFVVGPSSTSPRALTSNSALPAKSVVGSQVKESSTSGLVNPVR